MLPCSHYIALSTKKGELPKNEHEWLLDNNSVTELNLTGSDIWIQLGINPGNTVPEISKLNLHRLEFSGKATGAYLQGGNYHKGIMELMRF